MPKLTSLASIGSIGMGLGRKLPIQALQAILSSNADNVAISTLFTAAEWSSSTKKQVTINSGVTIGSTTSTAALVADTGFGGELEIINNGSIIGKSGAGAASNAVGGDGGNAFEAQQSGITLTNNGNIYAGGGGGGSGGQGGQGQNGSYTEYYYTYYQECADCFSPRPSFYCPRYYPYVQCQQLNSTTVNVYGTTGGLGGGGGDGAGSGGSSYTSGQAGAAGQTGANPSEGEGRGGTGGTGGTGGGYGQSGSAGNQGATGGNVSGGVNPGSGPSAGNIGFDGGAAGTAIVNSGNVTLINNGEIL